MVFCAGSSFRSAAAASRLLLVAGRAAGVFISRPAGCWAASVNGAMFCPIISINGRLRSIRFDRVTCVCLQATMSSSGLPQHSVPPPRTSGAATGGQQLSATANQFVDKIDPFAKRGNSRRRRRPVNSSRYHTDNEPELTQLPLIKGLLFLSIHS